jgi:hypothetical protein
MRHSIALVTGTTSGLGYAAARMLAAEGCRQVIVTGRSLARVQKTAAQLAAETNTEVFTPPSVKYEPHRAYADAKCIVAWWAAALARRLPSGMAVYTVSPGSTPDTLGCGTLGGLQVAAGSDCEAHPRHVPYARDRRPPVPPGLGVRNRRVGPILRLGAQEGHGPNGGDAPPALSRSRNPGSRVAGRRQGIRRRLLLRGTLERGILREHPIAAELNVVTQMSQRVLCRRSPLRSRRSCAVVRTA